MYEKIKLDILQEIKKGVFKPGDKIYSEGDLKKKYNVSSTTVVRALQDLVIEGYLIRRQGEGTFVRRNSKNKKGFFTEIGPIVDETSTEAKNHVEKTLTFIHKKVRNEKVEKLLQLEKGANLIQIVHLGMLDDTVWKVQIRYLNENLLDDSDLENIKKGGSLSSELKRKQHLENYQVTTKLKFGPLGEFSEAFQTIPEEIQLINWPINLSVIQHTHLTYGNKKPIEFAEILLHHKHYSLEIETEDN